VRTVTIQRCPTCPNIGSHTEQLVDELRKDPDLQVDIVDGSQGEFSVEVDGREINARTGESLREPADLAAEIRGVPVA
jgi:hypothetical protein